MTLLVCLDFGDIALQRFDFEYLLFPPLFPG
jgi:hypothetical protein